MKDDFVSNGEKTIPPFIVCNANICPKWTHNYETNIILFFCTDVEFVCRVNFLLARDRLVPHRLQSIKGSVRNLIDPKKLNWYFQGGLKHPRISEINLCKLRLNQQRKHVSISPQGKSSVPINVFSILEIKLDFHFQFCEAHSDGDHGDLLRKSQNWHYKMVCLILWVRHLAIECTKWKHLSLERNLSSYCTQ